MSTISVIVVNTENPQTWTRKTLNNKAEALKQEIDCEMLEFINLGEGLGMYLDEEGKLVEKPANLLMTKLFCAVKGRLDNIVGNVVLVGTAGDINGEDYSAPDWVENVLNNLEGAALIVIEEAENAQATPQGDSEFFNKGVAVSMPLVESCLIKLGAATQTSNLIGYDLHEIYLLMQAAFNSVEVPEVKLVRVLTIGSTLWEELEKFQVFTELYHPGKYKDKVEQVRAAICCLLPILGAIVIFMERNYPGGPIGLIKPNQSTPTWTEGATLLEDLMRSSSDQEVQSIVSAIKPYMGDLSA